jgi:hypothetical protein
MKQGGLWVCVSKTVCGFFGMHAYQKKMWLTPCRRLNASGCSLGLRLLPLPDCGVRWGEKETGVVGFRLTSKPASLLFLPRNRKSSLSALLWTFQSPSVFKGNVYWAGHIHSFIIIIIIKYLFRSKTRHSKHRVGCGCVFLRPE